MGTFRVSAKVRLFVAVSLCALAAGCTPSAPPPTQPPQDKQPIDVVSVEGPLQPFTPGGPTVEITLKNTSDEPVVSLDATLELSRPYVFVFDVSSLAPLLPEATATARLTLIAGGFDNATTYTLSIHGAMEDGTAIDLTKQVLIVEPAGA